MSSLARTLSTFHARDLPPPKEGRNRLFIVERTGLIQVVTNLAAPTRSLFLDLRQDLSSDYLEAGLLAMAFHPGYATNRQFFVLRTLTGTCDCPCAGPAVRDTLARFETSADNPNLADPGSEVRLISQDDVLDVHNGG